MDLRKLHRRLTDYVNLCLKIAEESYSTHPKAQISARLSTGFPRACSGDMYAAVPMITPICVAAAVRVGD